MIKIIMLLMLRTAPSLSADVETLTTAGWTDPGNQLIAASHNARHGGTKWRKMYDSTSSASDESSPQISDTNSLSSSSDSLESKSSEASSQETKEEIKLIKKYRVCTPCPDDMIKNFKNHAIHWICAGYQRARRTFKSECMMRFRNCQDGTMFVKFHEHRCEDDIYHGRHWFYDYRLH